MYIDTLNALTIRKSLRENTALDDDVIRDYLYGENKSLVDLKEFLVDKVDEVLIHHISRRLNGDESDNIINSKELLINKNLTTDFLMKYNFKFKISENDENKINMYYKDMLVDLDTEKEINPFAIGRLKKRLGQSECDFCINGYCIGDLAENNSYVRSLGCCPEFIRDLDWGYGYLNKMSNDYKNDSRLYIYSFKCKLVDCIDDRRDEVLKISNFLNNIQNYLLEGKVEENYLRVSDDYTVKAEDIVKGIDITHLIRN